MLNRTPVTKYEDSLFSEFFPVDVTCPVCGFGIELWNGPGETICLICGFSVFKHEKTTH